MSESTSKFREHRNGYTIDGTMTGSIIRIRKITEVRLKFPEVIKRASGAMLELPKDRISYFQTHEHDDYIAERISVHPERKVYFDMLRKNGGILPEKISDLPKVLYHSAPIYLCGDRAGEGNQLKNLQETGLIGSTNPSSRFYLSTSKNIALFAGGIWESDWKAYNQLKAQGYERALNIMLISVDPKKLVRYRDIYIDIESLSWDDEFKKNYVVTAGLPGKAITRIEVLQQLDGVGKLQLLLEKMSQLFS